MAVPSLLRSEYSNNFVRIKHFWRIADVKEAFVAGCPGDVFRINFGPDAQSTRSVRFDSDFDDGALPAQRFAPVPVRHVVSIS